MLPDEQHSMPFHFFIKSKPCHIILANLRHIKVGSNVYNAYFFFTNQ